MAIKIFTVENDEGAMCLRQAQQNSPADLRFTIYDLRASGSSCINRKSNIANE
jgi:hypothetical protein